MSRPAASRFAAPLVLAAGLALPADAAAQYGTPLAGGQSYVPPQQVVTTRNDDWAEALFSETSHDFGVVARGADTRTRVTLTNTTGATVHVSSVTTSCGCSAGSIDRQTLAPGETATLEISMDTKRFQRKKDSTVIVRFDAPREAEVRIPVEMYVRTDVVLTPGGVNFGAVDKGAGATRTVLLAYAGNPGWAITEIRGADPEAGSVADDAEEGAAPAAEPVLTASIRETGRTNATANYELVVTLSPDAPVGPVRRRLLLMTAGDTAPPVPVLVEGVVEDDITVRDVDLGTLAAGEEKRFNVVLRGKKPFKIAAMSGKGKAVDRFGMKLPEAVRPIHIVPMTFRAPAEGGSYAETFVVTVEGRDEPVTFEARGRVIGG